MKRLVFLHWKKAKESKENLLNCFAWLISWVISRFPAKQENAKFIDIYISVSLWCSKTFLETQILRLLIEERF